MAIIVVASYFIVDKEFARAVFLGGIVVALDLYYIDWSIKKKTTDKDGKRKKNLKIDSKFLIEGTIKSLIMFGAIFALLFFFNIDKVAFLVGLSSIFIAALIGLVF